MSTPPIIQSSPTAPSGSQQMSVTEYVSELISKRIASIQYLQRTYRGSSHWFNTIYITRKDLLEKYPNIKMMKRSCHFFALGLSLGTIIEFTNTHDYIKALNQLLSEFESHVNESSKQKMKNIFRKATRSRDGSNLMLEGGTDYTYLMIPHVSFELDYFEVFLSLSEMMIESYKKLATDDESQAYFELVLKCDSKLKKIIAMVSKELDEVARSVIKEELRRLDPLVLFSGKVAPIDFDGTEVL